MQSNDQNRYNRDVVREEHHDPYNNTHTTRVQTHETLENRNPDPARQAAFHKGYVQGRVSENRHQADIQDVRDRDTAARGLLLGIILTALVGLVGGTLWFLNEMNESYDETLETTPAPAATQSPEPQRETTIIERAVPVPVDRPVDRVVPVPVPVPQEPASQPSAAPQPATPPSSQTDIDITVPNAPAQTSPDQQVPPAQTPTQNFDSGASENPSDTDSSNSDVNAEDTTAPLDESAPDETAAPNEITPDTTGGATTPENRVPSAVPAQ